MSVMMIGAAGIVVLVTILFYLLKIGSREVGLPPGPPTFPFVGNLHQLPKGGAWLRQFIEWSREYGGIISLKITSKTIVVLSSPRLVRDFLDRRSASTSDRPVMKLADMITGGMNLTLARNGPIWRSQRRALHSLLNRQSCDRHLPIQRAEATQFMHDLVTEPKNFFEHTERQVASVMLSAAFGTRCPHFTDSAASEFFSIEREFDTVIAPGTHPPIDLVPLLQYVPERWASWKTICKDLRKRQKRFYYRLLESCERRMNNVRNNGCFLEDVIINKETLGLTREMIAYLGGVCLEGGASTTAIYIHRFMLCMMCYPEVQLKAQVELDSVVGTERLPQMDDIGDLPYVQSIIKEVHRFYPTVPLAIPHATTADESIEGYFIPEGSTIFMNIYGIYHDEEMYDKPNVFRPERFLESEYGTKPGADNTGLRPDFHFGSGRRICPGIHLANNTIIMNVMNVLWAFNLSKSNSDNRDPSMPITLDDFVQGISLVPKPFKCDIQPRSDKHAALIHSAFSEARSNFFMYEQELAEEDI